jgi:hypothetical protein
VLGQVLVLGQAPGQVMG